MTRPGGSRGFICLLFCCFSIITCTLCLGAPLVSARLIKCQYHYILAFEKNNRALILYSKLAVLTDNE